ncbi:TRAP-type C4-dicarboxylate transport system, permease component [Candidatus Vecturithrix granuli]|uniref:TRAP-type C4-dicarboxylate transport system, permease component n=1 Tax=Vecturithrix granuli TaxID=1499967 RepID=A0A081C5R5_VECG1|nr:TRAP-type C4-dicarboxylate transport system, permease component [Candidatus Vecturithrix granuli]
MTLIWFLIIGLFVLLATGIPVALAIGIPSLIYVIVDGSIPNFAAVQTMVGGANTYPLLAIPFFIFAGNLMNISGVTTRIFDFSNKLVGHIKGGLGHVNVIASVIFAGMSGAAIADAGGLGTIEITAMRQAGYDDKVTIGITAASSTIGPIIPPSMVAVIYAVIASASVGRLFAAGIIPGLLMGGSLMLLIYLMAGRYTMPLSPKASFKEILHSSKDAFFALLTPGIILGGIFFGIFTPTEAAAIASLYAIILGAFIYREMSWRAFYNAVKDSMSTTVQVMFIVVSATLFAWILAREQVPQAVASFILSKTQNYYLILFAINLILLIVGMFMETVASINILVPVFIPLMQQLGIDPVHFGVMMILNLMIGILTPPFGTVLFVLSSVAKVSVEEVAKDTMIFILPLLAVLALIVLFPQLTLFLPNLIFGQ